MTYVNNSPAMHLSRLLQRLKCVPVSCDMLFGSNSCRHKSTLQGTMDRYHGITVDVIQQIEPTTSTANFYRVLETSVRQWRSEQVSAAWLKFPIHYSRYIEAAAGLGFEFHHAEGSTCLLKRWLREDREDATPRFATHQLGVCGVVLREDTNELLMMQEKKTQFRNWKFPGGLADLGEDIGAAAVREVQEETGIRTDFKSVIAYRQQHEHPSAFGRSDMYVVCRLAPSSFDIVPCDHEVLQCQWMSIKALKGQMEIAPITNRIISLVLYGLEHGFDHVDVCGERMKSVYKGQHFKLFHRPLPSEYRK
ncbi:nucleoside diphosphate-linked moiety X motif 6-like isoform X2 [Dreissena polymorpha]|uniref:nucleoside diphosphate-linked moiety X motif 6-like isoform X2 n=1 Tax=Dreissena polymorpha TaxID=45954 RepID=UPI002264E1CB|nr:nucleoside diphosphate-linked moiety X motif 6-like isoform X2 [Dreissena polymorpha]